MSKGVYVQGVSVQEGICSRVSVRGVHVQVFFVLSPYRLPQADDGLGGVKYKHPGPTRQGHRCLRLILFSASTVLKHMSHTEYITFDLLRI